jgi:hypothetical protein
MRAERRNQTWNRRELVRSNSKAFRSLDVLFAIIGKKQSLGGLSEAAIAAS